MRATLWLLSTFLLAVPVLEAAGTRIRLPARDPGGQPVAGVILLVARTPRPPTGADGATEVRIAALPIRKEGLMV